MSRVGVNVKKTIIKFQKSEVTEYYIYRSLAGLARKESNRQVLMNLSEEELRHYDIWYKHSGIKIKPDRFKIWFYVMLARVFGVTFGIKLMERGETDAQSAYAGLSEVVPEAEDIHRDESEHESKLSDMIDEEKLAYMGSIVLGLNDALVEFMGALAGFTLALRHSRLIAMTGLIMGFSASLSMAVSEYISTKTESDKKNPLKASFYTGMAYVVTVMILVSPYFIFKDSYQALFMTIAFAVLLIAAFTFYSSVIKDIPFGKRFTEMAAVSIGVAFLSFLIGLAVRKFLHVDI